MMIRPFPGGVCWTDEGLDCPGGGGISHHCDIFLAVLHPLRHYSRSKTSQRAAGNGGGGRMVVGDGGGEKWTCPETFKWTLLPFQSSRKEEMVHLSGLVSAAA